MYRNHKQNIINKPDLILHRNTKDTKGIFLIKPHKSGDQNAYIYEEYNIGKKHDDNMTKKFNVRQPTNPIIIKPGNNNIVKRCLLIGINYTETNVNDCEKLRNFLINHKLFSSNDITMMSDYTPGILYPSKRNIINQLEELIKFARKYQNKQVLLFVAYSGNSTNETICPIDYQNSGYISSEFIKTKIINSLPSNVKLVMLFESFEIDLKYSYKMDERNTYIVIGKMLPTSCETIMINGKNNIIELLLTNYKDNISYNELVSNMRENVNDMQTPNLLSGKFIDIDSNFLLTLYKSF